MLSKNLLIILLSILLCSCMASVQMGNQAEDAIFKNHIPKANVAGVYIFRDEFKGIDIAFTVSINGVQVGQTAYQTYLYLDLQPGIYTITSVAENDSSIQLKVTAGELYYIRQVVSMGKVKARNTLVVVDKLTGQQGVNASDLAATSKLHQSSQGRGYHGTGQDIEASQYPTKPTGVVPDRSGSPAPQQQNDEQNKQQERQNAIATNCVQLSSAGGTTLRNTCGFDINVSFCTTTGNYYQCPSGGMTNLRSGALTSAPGEVERLGKLSGAHWYWFACKPPFVSRGNPAARDNSCQ